MSEEIKKFNQWSEGMLQIIQMQIGSHKMNFQKNKNYFKKNIQKNRKENLI